VLGPDSLGPIGYVISALRMLLVRTTTAYGAVDAYQRARHVRLYGDIHDGWSTYPGQASQGEFWVQGAVQGTRQCARR
jgi:hypothetical protein